MPKDVKAMTAEEIRARIIQLGFDGDRRRFDQFQEMLQSGLPLGTGVALRGSVVTGERWEDGAPFDAEGQGTSDLDVALVSSKVIECWHEDEFYIPGLHTKPLGDKAPDIAPALNPLRQELQRVARRPVNIQATTNFILFVRDVLLNEPYFMLIEADEEA